MEDTRRKIEELHHKIKVHETYRDKAIELRPMLKDRNAQELCDTHIKQYETNIEYLSTELEALQAKENRSSTASSASSPINSLPTTIRAETSSTSETSGIPSPFPAQSSSLTVDPPMLADANEKRLTTLELLRADTPLNRAKISFKLHELEYKINVEEKVQQGIGNMAKALSNGSDTKRQADAKKQLERSEKKMTVLAKAVRNYRDLYVGEDETEESPTESVKAPVVRHQPGARRPVTGKLCLGVVQAHELEHVPTRSMKNPQTVVIVKIGNDEKFRTRPSRSGRWEETMTIPVNKGSEVELAICDELGDLSTPIGLVWFKISDIAEHQRKQKLVQDQNDPNWVPGNVTQQQNNSSNSGMALNHEQTGNKQNNSATRAEEGVSGWFDVEPVGRIYLHISFVRENVNRRQMDKLGRAGAVRERIHEKNGHQFVSRKFYHIMKCALCGDFMVNSAYQCKDCGLACEAKCCENENVITPCMSRKKIKPSLDTEELKHNIPHHFVPLTNIKANWCCHCGFILPLGFRGSRARRCAACDVVCHTKCAALLPDFCGMSMKKANEMLREMKAANNRKTLKLEKGVGELTLDPQRRSFNNISSLGDDILTPQSSLSTPTRSNLPNSRPHSMVQQDLPSHQSMNLLPQLASDPSTHRNSFYHLPSRFGKAPPVPTHRKIALDDFNLLAVLGKGNFGKVMLAEEKFTQELYAIKVLKKRFVLDNDEIASTRSEKRAFEIANRERHPFLVSLHSAFQTVTRIYFVMEYVNGGDLMMHIQRKQFSEPQAKFYACEVLLALEYLHKNGIVYRDLKLDNIMLCDNGHIKLADYGLCKDNMFDNATTTTFCGTPEFMAPEILLEQPYGRAVDWWAFGVLLYEMLLGQSPFKGEDEDEIFDAVLEDEILYPIDMSRQSISICQELLNRDPSRRLGVRTKVRDHDFFAGVKWDDVLARKVAPPFLPTVTSRADTSNFDDEFTQEIPVLTPGNANLDDNDQRNFANFSYVSDWAV